MSQQYTKIRILGLQLIPASLWGWQEEEFWTLWSLRELVPARPSGKGAEADCSTLRPSLRWLLRNAILCCAAGVWEHCWSWVYWYGLARSECPAITCSYFVANLHCQSRAWQRLSLPLLLAVASRDLLGPNQRDSTEKLILHARAWLIFHVLRKWFCPGNSLHHQGLFTNNVVHGFVPRKPFMHKHWIKVG